MPDPIPKIPVYTFDVLLATVGLATKSTLKDERREPADGQPAAGQYWSGHDWVMLYRAADAVDMPPMSPGRQRLYDKNRTCAMCGARAKSPFPLGRDGNRYCRTCQEPAAKRLWEWERAEDRVKVTAWAREVLADRSVVLGARTRHATWSRDLVVDLEGNVLFDEEIRYSMTEPHPDLLPAGKAARYPAAAFVDQAAALGGRRLIAWYPGVCPDLATSFDEHGWPLTRATKVRDGDAVGDRYDRWVGQMIDGGSYLSPWPQLTRHSYPQDAGEAVARIREVLNLMAGGAPAAAGEVGRCCEFHDRGDELCAPDEQGGYCCDACPTLAAATSGHQPL